MPRVQQPPTVYCPSEQTDCLAGFPRSVLLMGVVIPEGCPSYGIHLALPALWSRSSHHSSLLAFVKTKFQLSSLHTRILSLEVVSGVIMWSRYLRTEKQEYKMLAAVSPDLYAENKQSCLGLAAGAVLYLAHFRLNDWFLCASGFPQGCVP